jgi:hypothetical protein
MAANALNVLKAAKHQEEADDWLNKFKGMQMGTGVSYCSAPVGAMSYSAAQLG